MRPRQRRCSSCAGGSGGYLSRHFGRIADRRTLSAMASAEEEPTQKTRKGKEIPIPTREEFVRNLDKVAPPVKRSRSDDDRPAEEFDKR